MITTETIRAIAIRVRHDSVTLSIAVHGVKRCPAPASVTEELQRWVRHPLRVTGLVARRGDGRLVSMTVQSFEVLRGEERASGAVLVGCGVRRGEVLL